MRKAEFVRVRSPDQAPTAGEHIAQKNRKDDQLTTFRNFLRPKDLIRGHTWTDHKTPTHKTLSSQLRPSGDITRAFPAAARVRKHLRLGSTLTAGPPHTEASHHPPSKVAHQRLQRMPYLRSRRGYPTYESGPRRHDERLPQQPLRHRQPGAEATTQGAEPSRLLSSGTDRRMLWGALDSKDPPSHLDHLLPATYKERLRHARRPRWRQASTRLHH